MIFQAHYYLTLLEDLYSHQTRLMRWTFILDDSLYFFDLTPLNYHIWNHTHYFIETAVHNTNNWTFKASSTINNVHSAKESSLHSLLSDQSTQNLQDLQNIYHYSVPTTKLFYPEPFIAAASFMHSDLWFVHILVYQYWLWFVFIFIVVFFIITFLCIVRWCNMRVRPRRETRGVSRSKCGDLITAIVPVSWAASIIISESTDAIDYFDGFGTTEMVIGIRAYQWGWEYYYPKDIDLNYNVKKNHSAFFGRSLKYNRSSETNLDSNKAWKFYQNKAYDFVTTPAHLLMIPSDNYKLLNYLNFSDVGTNAFHESSLFKHTRKFTKTNSASLFFTPSVFTLRFKSLTPMFSNDYDFHDSFSYGLKRQQNYLTSHSITNNFTTLFNLKSVDKLFATNYKTYLKTTETFRGKQQINFFKSNNSNVFTPIWLINQIHSTFDWNNIRFSLTKKFTYSTLLDKFNNDNDKKKLKNSLSKLFKANSMNIKLSSSSLFSTTTTFNNNIVANQSFANQFFLNTRETKKFFVSFSTNQLVAKPAQTPKEYSNLSPRRGNVNLSSKLNAPAFLSTKSLTSMSFTPTFMKTVQSLKSSEPQALYKLLNNRLYYDSPTPVFLSNKPQISLLNFDRYFPAEEETSFITFQPREEISPDYIYRAYWNTQGAQTDLTWRLNNVSKFNKLHNSFYLPFFTFGQDYDFLNWQGLTYLEDSYWENLASIYALDDYLQFFDLFDDYNMFDKLIRPYLRKNRSNLPADFVSIEPYSQDPFISFSSYSTSIYNEESLLNPGLTTNWTFSIFPTTSNLYLAEESFEYIKALSHVYASNLTFATSFSPFSLSSNNNIFTIDNFRANAEDFNWFVNEKKEPNFKDCYNILKLDRTLFELTRWNLETCKTFLKNTSHMHSFFVNSDRIHLIDLYFFRIMLQTNIDNFSFQKTFRMLSKLDLRASTRSATNMYNSYQKVYKLRFDENRSHAKTTDVAQIYSKQPNLTAPKAKLERSLGKNKTSFFQPSIFKNELPLSFNCVYDSFNTLNFYFFDFPFLLGLKSDPSRYYWTDWFARWGMFEVQPASASRYSVAGVPVFNKSFDFSAETNDIVYDLENYFSRLSRARRNYLPNWTHSPYIYTKNTFFFTNNLFFEIFEKNRKTCSTLNKMLALSSWYWLSPTENTSHSNLFNISHSGIHTYGRSSWTSNSPISSYYSTLSILFDTLTKREYLYREFLGSKKNIYRLSNFMTNSPSNPLLNDIKSVFLLTNQNIFNIEYSSESYYNSMEFFTKYFVKPELYKLLKNLGLPTLIFESILNTNKTTTSKTDQLVSENLKTQYKPMRRGILNMIRLHGTGAVAMPIEIRLQVLASSKDVIHSWAIPSAGVKIDCVPGYSSHRVIIFLVSGIFWGQCMEVCGRYHHWMPVIVYFMKRDLFFLWCTHFVFSNSNNMLVINDRQNTHYGRSVSFSKNSWINELK